MSLSATEMLRDCKKRYEICSNEIDILNKKILEMIKQYSDLSVDKHLLEIITKCQKELKLEQKKIDNFINNNPICTDIEDEVARYNELNNIAERVNKQINNIRIDLIELEDVVVDKERENLYLAFKNSDEVALDSLFDIIKKQFKDSDDLFFVKQKFIEKKHIYINMDKDSIYFDLCRLLKLKNLNKDFDLNNYLKMFNPKTNNDLKIVEKIKAKANEEKISTLVAIENSIALRENYQMQYENIRKVMNAIKKIGYNIDNKEITINEVEDTVYIHCENEHGKTVDFSIKLDGSLIYNFEGFENHEHDIDFNLFKAELQKQGVVGKEITERIYREPKYIKSKKITHINTKQKK